MADNDFPRALYKKSEGGNSEPVWGLGNFEVSQAEDQAGVDAALADGWTLRPDDEPVSQPKGRKAADPQPAPAGEAPQV